MSEVQPEVEVVKYRFVYGKGSGPEIGGAADKLRLGTVFRKSIGIYRRRFLTFFLLTAIVLIPYYIAMVLLPAAAANPARAGLFATWAAAVAVVKGVTNVLANGVVSYGVLQDLRGRRFSVAESLWVVMGRLLPLLGIVVCVSIGVGMGLFLLVVPGIVLACRWYVCAPVCIAERSGVFDSMGRSRDLTEGYRWQVFGAAFVVVLGSFIVGVIVGLVAARFGPTALQAATFALAAAVSAFSGVVVGVLYYELRVAKEGVDIDRIASVFD